MNDNPDVLEEISQIPAYRDVNLTKKVKTLVDYTAVVSWIKHTEIVQFKVFDNYENKGLPSDLKDIKKF